MTDSALDRVPSLPPLGRSRAGRRPSARPRRLRSDGRATPAHPSVPRHAAARWGGRVTAGRTRHGDGPSQRDPPPARLAPRRRWTHSRPIWSCSRASS